MIHSVGVNIREGADSMHADAAALGGRPPVVEQLARAAGRRAAAVSYRTGSEGGESRANGAAGRCDHVAKVLRKSEEHGF